MALLREKVRSTLSDGREVVVRSATPRDAKALTALLDGVAAEDGSGLMMVPGEYSVREWKRRIAATVAGPGVLYLVATIGDRLVATLNLKPDPHRNSPHVGVLGVTVARDDRRLGVASALLSCALGWAEDRGTTKVVLSVFPHNQAAVAFYESRGFSVEGVRRAQYLRAGTLLDEVIMARFSGDPGGAEAARPSGGASPPPSDTPVPPPFDAPAGAG